MGYDTSFEGAFTVTPTLRPEHVDYLRAFARTRRMERVEADAALLPDPIREAVGLPVGLDGSFFVGGRGFMGQENDNSISDYNTPPGAQPSLWCKWEPNEDGTAIEWNEWEKFHGYVPWIEYLIGMFLTPWGYVLNGTVEWLGEDRNDRGKIVIEQNKVSVLHAKVNYEP